MIRVSTPPLVHHVSIWSLTLGQRLFSISFLNSDSFYFLSCFSSPNSSSFFLAFSLSDDWPFSFAPIFFPFLALLCCTQAYDPPRVPCIYFFPYSPALSCLCFHISPVSKFARPRPPPFLILLQQYFLPNFVSPSLAIIPAKSCLFDFPAPVGIPPPGIVLRSPLQIPPRVSTPPNLFLSPDYTTSLCIGFFFFKP